MDERKKAIVAGRRPQIHSFSQSPSVRNPDFPSRIKELRILMEKRRLDACLLSSRNDILYYTGVDIGDSCLLLISESRPTLFVTSLSNEVRSTGLFSAARMKGVPDVAKRVKRFRRVGFDEYSTNFAVFSQLKKSKTSLIPSSSIIKEPRMVKDGWEMEQIAEAARIVRKAICGLGDISGKSEREVSGLIGSSFRKAGVKESFETIVASGRHSAFIHHRPDSIRIKGKDLVIVDAGALCNSYCSDMTRTFCSSPGPRERAIMESIAQIQAELIDMATGGVKYEDIQKRYESLLRRKHYKVMHSFGHGIGLGVHERPSKGDTLREGMVITVEPGAYIKGFGGCRTEDMLVVRKGKARVLTR